MAMWALPGLQRVGRWRRFQSRLAEANRVLREEIAARRRDPEINEREDVLSAYCRRGDAATIRSCATRS